jgi:pilus assembly protein FimV
VESRVTQLEAELAEARRLLEVRNAELATLQGGQAPAGQPEAAEPPAGVAPGAEAPAAGSPPTEAAAPPAEAQPAPAPKAKPEAKKPKPVPKAEEGPSLAERLAGYWWVLLGLLAAALAYVLYRRSRGESGDQEMDLQEALERTRTDLRARPDQRGAPIVVEERKPVESLLAPRAAGPRAAEPARRPISADDTISGEEPVAIEPGDALAEADFHMAYGLYDQAADLVLLAIKRAPQRRDLKLKLLEIYFVWGSRDRFLDLAREMNASPADAPPGEWDKILIMGKQIAPEDPLFVSARPTSSTLDMELHSSAGPLDMDLGAVEGSATGTVDFPAEGAQTASAEGGLDFEFTDGSTGTDSASLSPTIEMPRMNLPAGAEDPTQEVAIDELGLDVGDIRSLDDADGDTQSMRRGSSVEDTVESPRIAQRSATGDEDEDLLSASGIMKEQTGILRALDPTVEMRGIESGERTGELPTVNMKTLAAESSGTVDFPLGEEPFTMSEVGTKLDLARAYVDMGDPEGARSILEEVLKEGSPEQKQEAERLVASLP